MANAEGERPATGEISLFDVWNVLVRRRWIVFAVVALAAALSAVLALSRTPTYRLSQTIEVGEVESPLVPESPAPLAGAAQSQSSGSGGVTIQLDRPSRPPRTEIFEPPGLVAAELENVHVPAARAALAENDAQAAGLRAPVSAQAVSNTQLVRMTARVPASQVAAYERVMAEAADRLVQAHAEAERTARREFQDALLSARNAKAEIQDRLDARRSELDRFETREDLLAEQIRDLQDLLARAEAARRDAVAAQPDASEAVAAMLVANELREARQDLAALRERREVELPAQRAELRNEIAGLERRLEVAKGRVEQLKARMDDYTRTRVVSPVARSGPDLGTPWPVIVALGCILGLVAGILAAFFAEFAAAARKYRTASS